MKESAWAETVFVDIGYTVHEKNHHFNYFPFLMQNNYVHVLSSSSPSFVFFNGSLNLLWLLLNQCNSYNSEPYHYTDLLLSFVSYMRLNCRLNVVFSYFNTAITFFCVVVAANEVTVLLLSYRCNFFSNKNISYSLSLKTHTIQVIYIQSSRWKFLLTFLLLFSFSCFLLMVIKKGNLWLSILVFGVCAYLWRIK